MQRANYEYLYMNVLFAHFTLISWELSWRRGSTSLATHLHRVNASVSAFSIWQKYLVTEFEQFLRKIIL